MKRGAFALVVLIVIAVIGGAGYFMWQDREIIFENTTPTAPRTGALEESGPESASITPATSTTDTEKRENIFEFPGQKPLRETGSTTAVKKKNAPMKTAVTYTVGGWSPAVTRVSAGGEVTFVNKSGKPFQPAANPHPAHTSYPDFDAKREIPSGESFTFVFGAPGMIGYHDHLSPEKIGVINVE